MWRLHGVSVVGVGSSASVLAVGGAVLGGPGASSGCVVGGPGGACGVGCGCGSDAVCGAGRGPVGGPGIGFGVIQAGPGGCVTGGGGGRCSSAELADGVCEATLDDAALEFLSLVERSRPCAHGSLSVQGSTF